MGLDGSVYLGSFEQNASVVKIRYHQAESGSMGSSLVAGRILFNLGTGILLR